MTKDKSTLVEILQLVVPALSAILVAYFGYRQIIEPKNMEIAATQTAAVATQVVVASADTATASAALSNAVPLSSAVTASTFAPASTIVETNPLSSTVPTNPPPTPKTTLTNSARPSPVAAQVAVSTSVPATNAPTVQVVTITTPDGAIAEVLADTLTVHDEKALSLNSGETLDFEKIVKIEVGEMKGESAPLEITFTDGATLAASIKKDDDLVQGETADSSFQKNMYMLKQLDFPNEDQSIGQSLPINQAMVTITAPAGDMAQVVAETLSVHASPGLELSSGEFIPFKGILRIDVGELKGQTVPITITFTDNTAMAATMVKDADLVEGDTAHGTFQKNLYALKQVEFPNQP